jgi:transposase-like protein
MVLLLTERELRSIEDVAERLERQGLLAESQTLRSIVRTSGDRREVRASVAARILHVTPQTVRNWVKRGRLAGRVDGTGHVLVAAEAIRPAIELDAAMPLEPESSPDVSVDEILAEIEAHRVEGHST